MQQRKALTVKRYLPFFCALLISAPASAAKDVAAPEGCRVSSQATFAFSLQRMPLEQAAQLVANLTCRTFLLTEDVERIPISVVTPKGSQLTAAEVYDAFVLALHGAGVEARRIDGRVLLRRHAKRSPR